MAVTCAAARDVIQEGLAAQAFPAAVVETGRTDGVLWREAFGNLSYDSDAPRTTESTIFDLASLTKVIATTSLMMRAVESGRLPLDLCVGSMKSIWHSGDYARVTIRHLLDHSSGLPPRVRLWEGSRGRAEFEARILGTPLESAPGARSVYSDLDFMLLGFLLEDVNGASLDLQFTQLLSACGEMSYRPPSPWLDRIAPTEFDAWRGRMIHGEVHDENAAALDGVAGHAGLFGTAAAVGSFAQLVLRTFNQKTVLGLPETMKLFARRTGVPESSRALGWDTMLPTSSCGTRMSAAAIGHTGFTGTSLWIDPEQDRYVVLLTNRVHPTRANEKLLTMKIRSRVADAVMTLD